MIGFALASLLQIHSAPHWVAATQPAGTLLGSATVLADGRWFATDTTYQAWISADKGVSWSPFLNAKGDRYSGVFGEGIVVAEAKDKNRFEDRYDPGSDSWIPMAFDRKLVSPDTSVKILDEMWSRRGTGTYRLAMVRTDSVLVFVSTDSARSWKTFAVVPSSMVTGGVNRSVMNTAGSRFWMTDTVKKVFRSPGAGGAILDIRFPRRTIAMAQVLDSLADGRWAILVMEGMHLLPMATGDSGKTWSDFVPSSPDSLPGMVYPLAEGWSLGIALRGDSGVAFARHGAGGAWMETPKSSGLHALFVDQGRLYATNEAGLVYLDLKDLQVGLRHRSVERGFSWRLQGKELLVEGALPGEGWSLVDPSGRSVPSKQSGVAGDVRFSMPSRAKGVFLLRSLVDESRSTTVMVP